MARAQPSIDGVMVPVGLVQECPDLAGIVTTRERLRVREKHVVKLEGLAHPEVDPDVGTALANDAVRLFTMRAQRHLEVGDSRSVADVVDFHGNTSEAWGRSREGRSLMAAALEAFDEDEPTHAIARARVQGSVGVTCWRLGMFEVGAALGARALAVLTDIEPSDERTGCWWAAQAAGLCHFQNGRVERALEVLRLGHALADAGSREANSFGSSRPRAIVDSGTLARNGPLADPRWSRTFAGATLSATSSGPREARAGTVGSFARVFDADGTLAWAGGTGSTLQDQVTAVAVDASGRMYLAGVSHQGDRAFDAAVWAYDPPQP